MSEVMKELRTKLYGNTSLDGTNLMRKAKALHRAIPLIAQSLVEEAGKKISIKRMQGAGGCTDGRTLWLMDGIMPASNQEVDRFTQYTALKLGLVHHEVGHINETDFSVKIQNLGTLTRHCVNIIEDVRMENAHIRRFRAGRKYLDALSLASIAVGLNGPCGKDEPMISVFTTYLLYTLRARYRHEPYFLEFAEGARQILIERLDLSVVARIEAMLPRAAKLKGTQDSVLLAEDLVFLIEEEARKAAQQQQQNQQGQSVPGQPQGADSDDGDPDQAAGNGQTPGQGKADDSQDACSDASNSQGGGQADEQQTQKLLDAIDQLLNGDASDAKGDLDEAVRNQIQGLMRDIQQATPCSSDPVDLASIVAGAAETNSKLQLNTGTQDFTQAVSTVGRLSSRLKQKLQAQSQTRTGRTASGTRLYERHLPGVAIGDARIFRKSHRGIATDTAIFLLGDVSGSMSGPAIEIANQALYACAVAMQQVQNVDVAVGAFPGHQMVLRFGQRARHNMARFNLQANGGTPLEEGIAMAHTALRRNKRPRKILLVVTDGGPNDPHTAQAAIDFAVDQGIEVMAIGIQTTAVCNYFDRWSVIESINDLPEQLMGMLSSSFGLAKAA